MMNPDTYFRAFEQLEAERQQQPKAKRRAAKLKVPYSVRQLSSGCLLYAMAGSNPSLTRPKTSRASGWAVRADIGNDTVKSTVGRSGEQ